MVEVTLDEALERLVFDDVESARAVIAAAERELGGVDELTRTALLMAMDGSVLVEVEALLGRARWPGGKTRPVL